MNDRSDYTHPMVRDALNAIRAHAEHVRREMIDPDGDPSISDSAEAFLGGRDLGVAIARSVSDWLTDNVQPAVETFAAAGFADQAPTVLAQVARLLRSTAESIERSLGDAT